MIRNTTLLLAAAFGTLAPLAAAAASPTRPRSVVIAVSSIGDLARFRAIAQDTLTIVDKGDLAGARVRIRDLEKTWDDAEATMKPRDKATWTTIDHAVDEALVALRTPGPKAAECSAALRALLAKMDAVQKPA